MKMIIDTDPGVDDAMAYYYAHAHPDIDLLALTTIFGNVHVADATRNALWLTENSQARTHVYQGAEKPLTITPNPPSDYVHGKRGFGDVEIHDPNRQAGTRSAADYLVETAQQYPGEITLCAIGPLTNVALAVQKDAQFLSNLKQLVIMGGALDVPGNINAYAEANFWNDPHAANIVMTAEGRANVIVVGLDITNMIAFTPQDFDRLAKLSPKAGGFLKDIGAFYLSFYESRSGRRACSLHDPSAVIACLHPEVFDITSTPSEVVTRGDALGQLLRRKHGRQSHIAIGGDAEVIKAEFLRITGLNP